MKVKGKKSFKKYAQHKLLPELKVRRVRQQIKKQRGARTERRGKREHSEAKHEEDEHQATIQSLKEQDPEFHKYLEKHDPDVLKFLETENIDPTQDPVLGKETEEDAESNLGSEEEYKTLMDHEDLQGSDHEETEKQTSKKYSTENLNRWIRTKQLKPLSLAFREAVEVYEGTSDKSEGKGKDKLEQGELADAIILGTLKSAASMMDYHIKRATAKLKKKLPVTLPNYQRIKVINHVILSYGLRALRVYSDPTTLSIAINSAISLVPYMASRRITARRWLKVMLEYVVHDEESLRFQAFLFIRELARVMPYPFVDLCMKGLFLTLVRCSKTFNRINMTAIAFLMNCVVVLFGEDLSCAYQQAFVYIRQLAIYLRNALKAPSEENFQPIYNWQFVNSFRVLAMIISQYVRPNQLWPLVYPLCQVGCGMIDLFPSPKCFPLHLNIIGILNRIAKSSGVYVPVPPYIVRILSSPEFKKKYKPTPSDQAVPDLICLLRVKTLDFKCLAYQQTVFVEALFYLVEHLSLHAFTIGFPELVFPVVKELKLLKKSLSRVEWQSEVATVIKEITKNSELITQKRKNVEFGPKDNDKVALWQNEIKASNPPLQVYFTSLHEKRAERIVNQSKAQTPSKRKVLEDILDEDQQQAKNTKDLEDVDSASDDEDLNKGEDQEEENSEGDDDDDGENGQNEVRGEVEGMNDSESDEEGVTAKRRKKTHGSQKGRWVRQSQMKK